MRLHGRVGCVKRPGGPRAPNVHAMRRPKLALSLHGVAPGRLLSVGAHAIFKDLTDDEWPLATHGPSLRYEMRSRLGTLALDLPQTRWLGDVGRTS